MYDPAIGRWHVIDPAIEDNHFEHSPYIYVYNNPILLIDPDGRDSLQQSADHPHEQARRQNDPWAPVC